MATKPPTSGHWVQSPRVRLRTCGSQSRSRALASALPVINSWTCGFKRGKWWLNRGKWWFNREKWWFNWGKWWFDWEKWWFKWENGGWSSKRLVQWWDCNGTWILIPLAGKSNVADMACWKIHKLQWTFDDAGGSLVDWNRVYWVVYVMNPDIIL